MTNQTDTSPSTSSDQGPDDQQNKKRSRPTGKVDVMEALVQSASAMLLDRGPNVSVREIAAEAGVNHGLIHNYFGSKDALMAAAVTSLGESAAAELDEDGFPPADLATRRNGDLVRAVGRIMIDSPEDPDRFLGEHPILQSWCDALAQSDPDSSLLDVQTRVGCAASLALGWSLFGQVIVHAFTLDEEGRNHLESEINRLVADIGGLPSVPGSEA